MTFDNRIAKIEAKRARTSAVAPEGDSAKRESGLVTVVLWALFLGLVWAALAYPLGAFLAFAIFGSIGALLLLPYLWLRQRSRRASPERSAILDLLNFLNPFI